mmetsp:Transcript_38529/g.122141  ORF Transcript_38529/g.122141 Transcript_38529/m.122141 type:complete len:261 (+) Transcript_38529:727-1509(+)
MLLPPGRYRSPSLPPSTPSMPTLSENMAKRFPSSSTSQKQQWFNATPSRSRRGRCSRGLRILSTVFDLRSRELAEFNRRLDLSTDEPGLPAELTPDTPGAETPGVVRAGEEGGEVADSTDDPCGLMTSPLSFGKEGLCCMGAPAPISLLRRALWRLEPWPAAGDNGTSKASVTAAGGGCRSRTGWRGGGAEPTGSYPAYRPKDSVTGPGAAGRESYDSMTAPGAARGSSSASSSSEGSSTPNVQATYSNTVWRQSSLSKP